MNEKGKLELSEEKESGSMPEPQTDEAKQEFSYKQEELKEMIALAVNEKHAEWEKEMRLKKRKKRKRIILGILIIPILIIVSIFAWYLSKQKDPIEINEETIAQFSPIDQTAVDNIDAMERYSPEDTWTFYLYLVGSNLEGGNVNQLSKMVQAMIADEVIEIQQEKKENSKEQIMQLSQEIAEHGQELPAFLFAPEEPLNKLYLQEEEKLSMIGGASADLREYMSVDLPENVKFVIQTGGSAAWDYPEINPNRTQRFVLDSHGLQEVYNGPISNMGDADTLKEFLQFCAEEHPADHQVAILWNHGGAYQGFGSDHIYGDLLSPAELQTAFSQAFPMNRENPPLEMLYFACCLMSNAEVFDYLDGVAKYIVAAEEVTYTAPNACKNWLEEFVKDTSVNGAQLGKLIIDAYIEAILYMGEEYNMIFPTTMNLIDMQSAAEVYEAYGAFAKAALQAQIADPSMVSKVAEAAESSVFMALDSYDYYNTVDLTLFMEGTEEYFPTESRAVIEAVEKTMLYKRATTYLVDAGGVSIYYPYHLKGSSAVQCCLNYINHISKNADINAMYYYKLTGSMNDTFRQHCADSGYGEAQVLRYDKLYRLHHAVTEVNEEGNMQISLTEEEDMLLQDGFYELMQVDEDEIIYLGEDRYVDFGDSVYTDFPTTWVMINGVPLALEVINTTQENIQYCTQINYHGEPHELLLNYHYETEEMSVLGVRDMEYEAATLDRSAEPLEEGATFYPIYLSADKEGGNVCKIKGDKIKYKEGSVIMDGALEDGTYLAQIRFEDMRSDSYYTQPIRFVVKGGKIAEVTQETEIKLTKYR